MGRGVVLVLFVVGCGPAPRPVWLGCDTGIEAEAHQRVLAAELRAVGSRAPADLDCPEGVTVTRPRGDPDWVHAEGCGRWLEYACDDVAYVCVPSDRASPEWTDTEVVAFLGRLVPELTACAREGTVIGVRFQRDGAIVATHLPASLGETGSRCIEARLALEHMARTTEVARDVAVRLSP